MSTAVPAAAALVLYNGSEMALKTCTSASETSTSASEPSGEMETISHDPSSNLVRMQRKISSIGLIGCLFPTRSNGSGTRSFGSFRKRRQENSTLGTNKDKPKYVHTPQHAADSHARTTTPIPFSMRPLSQDVAIQLIKAPAKVAESTSLDQLRVNLALCITAIMRRLLYLLQGGARTCYVRTVILANIVR
ncbi:uncharacterized protein DFL_003059 [Arthrobotrys flagrans]|uniref:Uncharacterized protein n=1 Tax=Arthrobotrys flagrans TaxID=97331 RepID=A0A437ACB1_ARTFL|nr:hypothetical protein DFL_003059 [Arthrobotrys flagrans]